MAGLVWKVGSRLCPPPSPAYQVTAWLSLSLCRPNLSCSAMWVGLEWSKGILKRELQGPSRIFWLLYSVSGNLGPEGVTNLPKVTQHKWNVPSFLTYQAWRSGHGLIGTMHSQDPFISRISGGKGSGVPRKRAGWLHSPKAPCSSL